MPPPGAWVSQILSCGQSPAWRSLEILTHHMEIISTDHSISLDTRVDEQLTVCDGENKVLADITPSGRLSSQSLPTRAGNSSSTSERGGPIGLVPELLLLFLPALSFATFRLATSNAALLALRDVVAFLLHGAQDAGSGNLLPKPLQQAPLRFSWSKFNLSQLAFTSLQALSTAIRIITLAPDIAIQPLSDLAHLMHRLVSGRTANRSGLILSPHTSQMPYVPWLIRDSCLSRLSARSRRSLSMAWSSSHRVIDGSPLPMPYSGLSSSPSSRWAICLRSSSNSRRSSVASSDFFPTSIFH